MNKHYDVIVVGLGAMGTAAAFHLASRGLRVLGLEQFQLAHDRGSSHGETRLIRQAYFENPDYVPLLFRAYELWSALESEIQERLFERNGIVIYGRPGISKVYDGALRSARLYSIPMEELSGRQAQDRWPMYQPPEGFDAAFEPGAGFLYAERSVLAHAEAARRRGAELHENEAVQSYQTDGSGVKVRTGRSDYTAAKLVLAGGGWNLRLLRDLGLPLELRRMLLGWFQASDQHAAARGVPGFIFDLENDFFYGFPQVDGRSVKMAGHHRFEVMREPEEKDAVDPNPARIAALDAFSTACLPLVSRKLLRAAHCIYTMTPDEDFVIDIHPQNSQLIFAAGFSGHGFKFAPVVGEILADLAIQGRTRHPIGFLSASRFSKIKPS